MKTNPWLFLGVMLSTSLLAQPATTPSTSAGASAVETAAPVGTSSPLVPGPAVVNGTHVNVRAQAKLNSEIITRLNTGDPVTVLDLVNAEKPKAGEPHQWARIAFPKSAAVWVFSTYIDVSSNMVVLPKRLNLRAGPGENYSIVGRIEAGTPVNQLEVKGNWMKIEPPSGAYAFMAAEFLQPAAPPPTAEVAATQPTTEPTPETEPVTTAAVEPQPTVAQPVETPEPTPLPAQMPVEAATPTPETESAPETTATPTPTEEQPVVPRVVSHEGVVKPTISIQAPTDFALISQDTGKIVNFLHSSTTNLDLRRYNGLHIVVTGAESLDKRWTNTPVITIQRIQVLE